MTYLSNVLPHADVGIFPFFSVEPQVLLFSLTVVAAFPFLQQGDRLVWSVSRIEVHTHAISIYGAAIQISRRGYTPGYLNQTLVSEIPTLCVLGISHSNSSFHRFSCSPWTSPLTQAGGYTTPPEVVRAQQTPKELHL